MAIRGRGRREEAACCQGTSSTYRTMMGRGAAITGPYTNKSGTSMLSGAAEQLLTLRGATSGRAAVRPGGRATRICTRTIATTATTGGASKLQIRPIVFGSDDWVI